MAENGEDIPLGSIDPEGPSTPMKGHSHLANDSKRGPKQKEEEAWIVNENPEVDKLLQDKYKSKLKLRTSMKATIQGRVYNFLERPTGWKCFIYHFTV